MKLNLVPTHVSKERQGKSAVVVFAALVIVGFVLAVLMTTSSKRELDQARADNDAAKPPAAAAVDMSNYADTLIASAAQTIKDANLAQAMIAHNDTYPDFYTKTILPYLPPFFRIQSLSASPTDATTCTVTMVGTLKTYQQYADLALALMRIPNAVSVGRAGYTGERFFVPALTEQDQVGRYRHTTDAPIPDDPQDRLAYEEAQGSAPVGYQNVGGYGSGTTEPRGATPDESLITVQITISKDLQTPDPPATLRSGGGGGALTGMAGMAGGMGGPGAGPGMAGPPPGVPGAAGAGGAAAGGKAADD